jgi:hypothetical protein
MTTAHAPRRPKPVAILIVPLLAAIVLALFAWPSARLEPRDLPVGVAGAPAASDPMAQRLAANEGSFDIHRYGDEASARNAIEDREIYGAFVAGPGGGKVLTASAASPMVAQMLTHAAAEGAAPMPVEDVVTVPKAGSALASSVLPLVIAGILCGVLATVLASGALGRAGLLVAGSALAGLAGTAIVQSWLDVVGGDWAANAATLGLTVLAIGSFVAGLKALLGEAGLILGVVTMVLVGNPFSGVGSAPELLPEPVGGLGRLLPPGAGGNLLRSTGFFDGAGAGQHVAVLAAWAAVGFGLLLAAAARRRRPATVVAPAPA